MASKFLASWLMYAAPQLGADAAYMFENPDISIGCLAWNMKDSAAVVPFSTASTVKDCQAACKSQSSCQGFSFDFSTSSCLLAQTKGTMSSGSRSKGIVSGPPTCTNPAEACVALPSAGWPGDTTIEASNAWPMGYQPQMLQCWPRGTDKRIVDCPNMTILADMAAGWLGECEGLGKVPNVVGKLDCQQSCFDNPYCATWVSYDSDGACYQGVGKNCHTPMNGVVRPSSGQMIMHGSYRVLKDLSTVRLLNLTNVFDQDSVDEIRAKGQDPAKACKAICLSAASCQYWQLYNATGCWVELWPKMEMYPLQVAVVTGEQPQNYVIAGEFLQKYCPAYIYGSPFTAPTAAPTVACVPVLCADGTLPPNNGQTGCPDVMLCPANPPVRAETVQYQAPPPPPPARFCQQIQCDDGTVFSYADCKTKDDCPQGSSASSASLGSGSSGSLSSLGSGSSASSESSASSAFLAWWVWLLIALLSCLLLTLLLAALYFCFFAKKKSVAKRSVVKAQPPSRVPLVPPTPPPQSPQPVMTTTVPTPMYQPVMQPQPVFQPVMQPQPVFQPVTMQMPVSNNCVSCGAVLAPDANFCRFCGRHR